MADTHPTTEHSVERTVEMPSWSLEEYETHLLNVDVDVWARFPLDLMVAAFGERVFVHYVGSEGKMFGAHFSIPGGGRDVDKLTQKLAALVTKLPRAAKVLWNRAISREFNIGIQAGVKPHSSELRLEHTTLAAVARVHGRLVITTYAPEVRSRPGRSAKSRAVQQVDGADEARTQPRRRRGPRS
jgi:hypothetical protein